MQPSRRGAPGAVLRLGECRQSAIPYAARATVTQTPSGNPASLPEPASRVLSLDVARGITIAFMIMVNNNGGRGSWGFMNHAEWNGLTATDLVFPASCS